MKSVFRLLAPLAISALLAASCGKQELIPGEGGGIPDSETAPEGPGAGEGEGGNEEDEKPSGPVIPPDLESLAKVYIDTPGKVDITSKTRWVELCTIRIEGDGEEVLYQDDSLMIRGRGNSTWSRPKKPYYFKLDHKADFLGTGKSHRWVLLANWMDRTLLRNDVAFEAARRTSLDWTPSGEFVELYLNGQHKGNYWLGEKIRNEGSKFEADFLYTMDTSDGTSVTAYGTDGPDFFTSYGRMVNSNRNGMPIEIKAPEFDDFETQADFLSQSLNPLKSQLSVIETAIYQGGNWQELLDVDSFCDWYLVHELCYNMEPNHPKSCFAHIRDGKLYAGPVWDFDWLTFTPANVDNTRWNRSRLDMSGCWYFGSVNGRSGLWGKSEFKARLKERWAALKPGFETLPEYIDRRADRIRSSEAVNHEMWPCYPNSMSEDGTRMVNHDEQLSFQDAVNRMKSALTARIQAMDSAISAL